MDGVHGLKVTLTFIQGSNNFLSPIGKGMEIVILNLIGGTLKKETCLMHVNLLLQHLRHTKHIT